MLSGPDAGLSCILGGHFPAAAMCLIPLATVIHHKESGKFIPNKAAKTDGMKCCLLLKVLSQGTQAQAHTIER